jgi:hypothetical protein
MQTSVDGGDKPLTEKCGFCGNKIIDSWGDIGPKNLPVFSVHLACLKHHDHQKLTSDDICLSDESLTVLCGFCGDFIGDSWGNVGPNGQLVFSAHLECMRQDGIAHYGIFRTDLDQVLRYITAVYFFKLFGANR